MQSSSFAKTLVKKIQIIVWELLKREWEHLLLTELDEKIWLRELQKDKEWKRGSIAEQADNIMPHSF